MKTNQEKVLEFTEAFNMFKTPYGEFSGDLLRTNPKTSKLRYDLINEEYTELMDAFREKDFKEVIDALTDILYVTYGAGIALGLDLDKSFPTISMKFRRKEYVEEKTHFENIVGAYTLDDTSIKTKIFEEGNESELNCMTVFAKTIARDVSILKNILIDFETPELLEEVLNRINYKVYSLGVLLRINLDRSFTIVHDSNMSKVCKNKEVAEKTVQYYLDNEVRYDSPVMYPIENDRYIVRNQSTGKALKSIDYTPACFLSMMECRSD